MHQISPQALLNYIEHNQVAFKFCDSLMSVTHPGCESFDFEEDEVEYNEMKKYIAKADEIRIVNRDDLFSPCNANGFDEMAEFARLDDLLIVVNGSLALCLPKSDSLQQLFLD